MSVLETPRYWCYLLAWSLSIANRTIICEYLSFGNRNIKREWREYHLARDCNIQTFYSQTNGSTSNKIHVLALYAVQNYCILLLIINWKSVFFLD